MSELYLACRDGVGINSTVILNENPTLIKNLPKNTYDLYHQNKKIGEQLGPNEIPGVLLKYCTRLESDGFDFKGRTIYDMISNLEIITQSK